MAATAMVLVSLAFAGAVAAQDAESLADCLGIAADTERLACYDRLAGRWLADRAEGSGAPDTVATGAASTAGVPAEGAPEPGAPAEQADDAQWFGLEWRAASRDLDALTAHVVGGFKGWDGRTRFVLDNGQVWEQVGAERFRYNGPDLPVRIRRGSLSSFLLSPEGFNRSTRVRRIE